MTIPLKYIRPMKLRLLIISVWLLLPAVSFSQKKGFNAGVLAGIVPSQVDGDSYGGYHKVGLQAGLFSEFVFNKQVSLITEIKYINKGAKQVSKDNTFYYKSSLNYVEVPFALQYYYKKGFSFNAGLAFGYLISYSENFGWGNVVIDPQFKKYEFSGFAGIGYKISEKLLIVNRFQYSILPVRDYPLPSTTIRDRGWNNNTILIGLYYKFL